MDEWRIGLIVGSYRSNRYRGRKRIPVDMTWVHPDCPISRSKPEQTISRSYGSGRVDFAALNRLRQIADQIEKLECDLVLRMLEDCFDLTLRKMDNAGSHAEPEAVISRYDNSSDGCETGIPGAV